MANTPHGYPYPVGTDRLMDGDDSIHALASAVDSQLGAMASGSGSVPTSAINTPASLAITFPVGRFTAPPNVVATVNAANPQNFYAGVNNVTASGFSLFVTRTVGTTPTTTYWVAHQI